MAARSNSRYQVGGDNSVLRSAVHDASKGRCWWCMRPFEYRDTQLDHIIPQSTKPERLAELIVELNLDPAFDVHDPANLGLICGACNNEKSNNDFTRSPRALSRLHQAAGRRDKIVRLVETFGDQARLASALLHAKEADLSDHRTAEVLREHGPGFVQALVNVDGFRLEYTEYRTVDVLDERGIPNPTGVSLDASGRRALSVLEDGCGLNLDDVVPNLAESVEDLFHKDVASHFNSTEVPGGGAYSGEPVRDFLDLQVSSLSVSREEVSFRFVFEGSFESLASASVLHDRDRPGELVEAQGDIFASGTYSVEGLWSFSAPEGLELEPHSLEYDQFEAWIV